MEGIQALREQKEVVGKRVRSLVENNKGAAWTDDMQRQYDEGMNQIESVNAEIKRITDYQDAMAEQARSEHVAARADKIAKDERKPELAVFAKWARGGDKALNVDDWKIYNTMSTTTTTEGGHTVPTEVAATVVDKMKAFGGMRSVSDIIRTNGFGDLNFPGSDGTSEVGELIGQNTTATAADPSFTVVTVSPYKYSSKIVAIPYELLQDSAADMEGFITGRLAQRLGRITNTHYTTGTGSGQPNGVVTASTQGRVGTTGQTTTVIFDDLVLLVHSVDPAYRAGNNCRFMMNDASFGIVRRIKDSQNRPVFIPGWDGISGSMSDKLLGYDVVVNQDVASMAANAKSILFGDFSYYKIRDVMDMRMFRFEDSAYAKLGQVGFLAWMRTGGNLVDTTAVKHYANSAT